MAVTQKEILDELKKINENISKGFGGNNSGTTSKGGSSSGRNNQKFEDFFSEKTSVGKKSYQDKQKEKFAKQMAAGDKAGAKKTLKTTAKANVAGAIAGAVADGVKQVAQFSVKMKELELKDQKIKLEAAAKSLQVQTALYGNALNKAVAVGADAVVGDIKDNTYNAMNNTIELGKQNMLATFSLAQIDFDKNTDLQINAVQKKAAAAQAAADAVGGVLSSIPNPYTAIAGAVISGVNAIFQAESEKEIMQMEYAKEQMNMLTEFKSNMLEQTEGIVKKFADLTRKVDNLLMELDNNAHIVGRGFGFAGKQLETYVKTSAQLNIEMAKMGKSYEDLMKAQNSYISSSDRNHLMSGEEGKRVSALGTLLNLEDAEIGGMMGALNLFNTSIESGSDIMFEMYKTANKMGVSNQKFAKDMQKNLKLAEKYQFKGGVKAMMDMALWAQKTRFNLDELAGALEKMHTGNIEDVLTTSARLNVLGGNAGILSDPMSMMFNAYMDPRAYAENINQMIKGYGTFNEETGETEFNVNEQMRMEAMANALGISKENFMNQARQSRKEGILKSKYGNRFNEDEMTLLTQHATFDRNSKEWVVNVMGADGSVQQKNVNELTNEDLKSIFPEDTQEQLVKYTEGIFSLLQQKSVVEKTNSAQIMSDVQDSHRINTLSQIDLTRQHQETYRQYYAKEAEKGFDFATSSLAESFEQSAAAMIQKDEEGKTLSDKYYSMSLKGMETITQQIPAFQAGLSAILDDDTQALLAAMAQINPDAAVEVRDAINGTEIMKMKSIGEVDYKETLAKRFGGSGSALYAKVKAMNYDTDNMNGAFGRTDDDRMMASIIGDAATYTIKDPDGKYYLVRAGSFLYGDNGNRLEAPQGLGEKMLKSKKVNDLIISPRNGTVYETDSEDTITASRPGGAISRNSGGRDNMNLTVNGTLTLSSGNQKIDLMELVRNDPNSLRRLTEQILLEASRNKYGGRNEYNANRYTIS